MLFLVIQRRNTNFIFKMVKSSTYILFSMIYPISPLPLMFSFLYLIKLLIHMVQLKKWDVISIDITFELLMEINFHYFYLSDNCFRDFATSWIKNVFMLFLLTFLCWHIIWKMVFNSILFVWKKLQKVTLISSEKSFSQIISLSFRGY